MRKVKLSVTIVLVVIAAFIIAFAVFSQLYRVPASPTIATPANSVTTSTFRGPGVGNTPHVNGPYGPPPSY